jgi:hypothetical protein
MGDFGLRGIRRALRTGEPTPLRLLQVISHVPLLPWLFAQFMAFGFWRVHVQSEP